MVRLGTLLFSVAVISSLPAADPPARVFRNATIYTAAAYEPISDGILVVINGKISVVASAKGPNSIGLPEEAETIDLKGAVVIPGLVDTHSHIGIFGKPGVQAHADGNEGSGPVQPGLR